MRTSTKLLLGFCAASLFAVMAAIAVIALG
jgi:hypothetical protein